MRSSCLSPARVVCSNASQRLRVTIRGSGPLLLRRVSESRSDNRQFVVHQKFNFREPHQDFFGLLEVVTLVEYIILRMKSALPEDWTEDKVVVHCCIQKKGRKLVTSARCWGGGAH